MGAQLSLKAALPLAERIATASDRRSKTGRWLTLVDELYGDILLTGFKYAKSMDVNLYDMK